MEDHGPPKRATWRRLLLLLLTALVAWQAAQALGFGTVGIPGVFLVRLSEPPLGTVPEQKRAKAPELGEAWRRTDDAPAPGAAKVARAPDPAASASPVALPSEETLGSWARAQAREFVGGVDENGNILYRFDVWLEMPEAVRKEAVSVAYAFDAPSATPPEQTSNDASSGFRVKFGGAACAQTVRISMTFADGRTRDAEVDGCKILN